MRVTHGEILYSPRAAVVVSYSLYRSKCITIRRTRAQVGLWLAGSHCHELRHVFCRTMKSSILSDCTAVRYGKLRFQNFNAQHDFTTLSLIFSMDCCARHAVITCVLQMTVRHDLRPVPDGMVSIMGAHGSSLSLVLHLSCYYLPQTNVPILQTHRAE